MALFPWGRAPGVESDGEAELLREALIFALSRLAERGVPAETARLEAVITRLAQPPVPTGLVRHLSKVVQGPRPDAGARDGVLAEAAGEALSELATTALASCLLDPRLEASLEGLRRGVPGRVGVQDARRVARGAADLRVEAIPLRKRAAEEREEMIALVATLGRELSRVSGKGESLGADLRDLVRLLSRELDPEGMRSARQELLQRVEGLASSTSELQRELDSARQRTADLEERLARKEAELVDVRSEAVRDPLTGLCNRRAFERALVESIRRAGATEAPLCLVLLDVDHFKSVNDTWGHPAGDAVLRNLAESLQEQVREGDLPARVGGEELAVILPGAPLTVGLAVAERIRETTAAARVEWGGQLVAITVSCGVASWDGRGDHRALYRSADQALYAAKSAGRDRVECAD